MAQDKTQEQLFCEIVAQLLIADAKVTDEERAFLQRLFDRFGFDEATRQAVYGSVDIGQPIGKRLGQLAPERRAELLSELEQAATLDGEIASGEQQILDEVRAALE